MKPISKLVVLYLVTCSFINPANSQGVWSAVGSGLNAPALTMAVYGSSLYIGKLNFTTPDEINKWDGTTLSGVGAGTNGPVGALLVDSGVLYVGGGFTTAGAVAASDVAKWNGTGWAAVGSAIDNFCINAMAVYKGELYAAGYGFTASATPSTYTIAKWNGTNWAAVGSGLQGGDVYCLTVHNNSLYASGTFTNAGSISAIHIAKWNDTAWSAVGTGITDGTTIYTMKEYGSDLYVGGNFSTIGGIATNCIAKWDGAVWSKVGTSGTGINNTVIALASSGGYLYAGGAFNTAGGVAANHIAKWNGSTWSALGSGIGTPDSTSHQVWSIAAYNGSVYAAGQFPTAGGVPAINIARWTSPTAAGYISPTAKEVNIYPNPLDRNSVVAFYAAMKTNVAIDVYDITGRHISTVFAGQADEGAHQYPLGAAQKFAAGVYIVRIATDIEVYTGKLIVN